MRAASITVDLDTSRFYREIHGLEQSTPAGVVDSIYTLGVRRLLDLFKEHAITSTLFVIGEDVDAPEHAELLTEAHHAGHELGNHTYHHRYDLRAQPHPAICQDIARGEEAIERITGEVPCGFRTPGYNIDVQIFEEIERRGYLYDSSIFSCPPYYLAKGAIMGLMSIKGTPSRSMMTPASSNIAPTRAYRPSRSNIWRSDRKSQRMWEVPMCVLPGVRFPLIGTSLHLIGERGFAAALPLLKWSYPRLLQLEFHAIDFMDATDPGVQDLVGVQPDLKVPWEKKRALYASIFNMLTTDHAFLSLRDAIPTLGSK